MIYQALAVILALAIGIIIGTYASHRETNILRENNSLLVSTYTTWIHGVADFNKYIMTHLEFVVASKDNKIKEPNIQLIIGAMDSFQRELDKTIDIEE